jgi:hypothetical protein
MAIGCSGWQRMAFRAMLDMRRELSARMENNHDIASHMSRQHLLSCIEQFEILLRESERMAFISLTRLRIRSLRFVPLFALHTWRSLRQIRSARGFQTGAILADRGWTFWTMTAWDNEESMRQFMVSGAHKTAMPHLVEWCDEASVAHWTQPDASVLSWEEADRRMREYGRSSKVRNPSPQHATLTYRPPRTIASRKIK